MSAQLVVLTLVLLAVVLATYALLRDVSHTLLKRALQAGPADKQRLRSEHPEVAIDASAARATAHENEAVGCDCIRILYGEDAPKSAWILPFFIFASSCVVMGVVAVFVTVFFNQQTWSLPPWATLGIGLGIPAAIIMSKFSGIAGAIGDVEEIRSAREKATRDRNFSTVPLLLAGLVFAVSKSVGEVPDAVSLLALTALECALGLSFAALLSLTLIHGRAPLHFLLARLALAKALRLAAVMEVLAMEENTSPRRNGATSEDGSARGNGGARIRRHARNSVVVEPEDERRLPAPKSAKRLPDGGPRDVRVENNSDDNDALPYRHETRSFIIGLGLSALLVSGAQATTVRLFVDRTPSVYARELCDVLPYVGQSLAAELSKSESDVLVELYLWNGDPLSSRVPTKRWALDSLAFNCQSPFPMRCRFLREQALAGWRRSREPILDEFTATASQAATAVVPPARGSCVSSMLQDAQAAPGLAVVVTDAELEFCPSQSLVPAKPGSVILVVVLARAADGPRAQERIAARIGLLRALGYHAVDARSLRFTDLSALVHSPQTPVAQPVAR